MKGLLIVFLLFSLIGCKAQAIPEFAKAGDLGLEPTSEEFIAWYNKTAVAPQYDTVTVFRTPDFSDLRYVIIRPISAVARVEYKNGRFIGWLSSGSMWIEHVKFDEKGRVVQGMNEVMISSIKEKGLIVQYERCPECKYYSPQRGKL